ncbi:replicative DNA helicase [Bacillus luti]
MKKNSSSVSPDEQIKLWQHHIQVTEANVLCSILFHTETKSWGTMNPPDPALFRIEKNRKLAKSYRSMSEITNEPNVTLLLDMLSGMDLEERKKWKHYIDTIASNYTPQNIDTTAHYIDRLRHIDILQSYFHTANVVKNKIMSVDFVKLGQAEKDVMDFIENAFFDIERKHKEEIQEMRLSDGLDFAYKNSQEELNGKPSSFISLGFPSVNKKLSGGIPKKTFGLFAGRPGMGKTAAMINASYESAIEGTKSLFISIEMTLLQLFQRLLCRIANVSMKALLNPNSLTPSDWKQLADAVSEASEMTNQDIFFYETTKLSPAKLERTIKHYKRKYGIDMVYVDYVQIMCMNDGRPAMDDKDMKFISNEVARIAKELDVAIALGSQLNRDSENRSDRRPQQSDIRGSGALEQDASVIIGLYRDEVYNKDTTESPNIIEFIILKARFGEIGTVELFTNLQKQLVTEIENSITSPPPDQLAA